MDYTTTMELQLHDGDELFQIMKSKMTTEQEQMFLLSHYLYLEHGADSTAFVVDFDMVWKSVEFTTRGNAKRILVKKFAENVDYTIIVCGKTSAGIDDTSAGARLCDETSVENIKSHLDEAAYQSGGAAYQSGENAYQSGGTAYQSGENAYQSGGTAYQSGENAYQSGKATWCDETSVAKVHGGQNKEQILLTVDCFKQFCFIAATPKAKEIRNYYIKMENIMHEYYKKFNNELKHALQLSQIDAALERHQVLIETNKNKWLVYFCKIKSFEDGSFILKVGETIDIKNRMEALKSDFGMNIRVLDVFVCENSIKFEKSLHSSSQLVKYRYHQLERKNKKFSTEAYRIPNRKEYEKIVSFAKEEMNKYNNIEITKLSIVSSLIPLCKNYEEVMSVLDKISSSWASSSNVEIPPNNVQFQTRSDSEHTANDEEDESMDEETPSPSTANANGPIVQIYHKDDLNTVVNVYMSIMEATRDFNYNNKTASYTAIKKAYQCNTIYLDYRWNFIFDRAEQDLDKPRMIGETIVTREKNQGQVAMLNLDKTKIIKVFRIAKDAAKEILQHPSAMCFAIKHSSPLSNHYWMRLKHVDASLQRAYLESNIIPQKQKNIRGTQIKLVNPTTNELIKTFSSYTEIQKELKISMRKIRECIETNSVCRGKYKFVKCSS